MPFLNWALEISLRGLALAAIAGLGLWIFRVRSASLKHMVWMAVLIGMLAGAAFYPVLPAIPLRVLRAVPAAAPSTASLPYTPVYRTAPEAMVQAIDTRAWIAVLYGCIATLFLLRLMLGYRSMRRLVQGSVAVRGEGIRESAEVAVPMTAGVLRPVILLPMGWRDWSGEKLAAVLAHEGAHIQRHDWAVMLVARINRSVFWFHPLAWWLERKLAVLAEDACDDAAVARVGNRAAYAQALIEVAGAVRHGRVLREGIAMARTANVEKRIDRVLDESRNLSRVVGRAAACALAVISGPVSYLAWAVQLAPAQTMPQGQTEQAKPPAPLPAKPVLVAQAQSKQTKPPAPPARPLAGPWQKWLTQEVVYIITDEERATFLRLNTDPERERFSERFWARRDPVPGTATNQYRDEHYRRIAYSNERFAAAVPGWQTDRGRIYIVFGPPDEIESHPSQGPNGPTVPFDKWLYRYLDGIGNNVIFTFTDANANGDYRLSEAVGPRGVFKPVK